MLSKNRRKSWGWTLVSLFLYCSNKDTLLSCSPSACQLLVNGGSACSFAWTYCALGILEGIDFLKSTDQSKSRRLRYWGPFVAVKCGGASQLISEDKGIYDFYGIYQYCCLNIWFWNLNSSIWIPTSLSFSLFQLIPIALPSISMPIWEWIVMFCCCENAPRELGSWKMLAV